MSTRSLLWRWPVSRFGLFVLDRRKWDANPLDFGMHADVMAKVRHRFRLKARFSSANEKVCGLR
jgi:hypothetical protein